MQVPKFGAGIGAAVAVSAMTLGGWLYWTRFQPQPEQAYTPAEKNCLAHIAAPFTKVLHSNLVTNNQRAAAAIAQFGRDKDQPALDAQIAKSEYDQKIANLKTISNYCGAYATCLPGKPYKQTFDGCYSVMSANPDDDSSGGRRDNDGDN